ncbi:MAG: hypothetical protein AAFP68_10385 [Pseudomonadota bacterium]
MIRPVLVFLLLWLAACGTPQTAGTAPEGAPGDRLSAEEVKRIFVGVPWKSASGVFNFSPDGTYRYRSTKTTTEWGPWPYIINDDGSIRGVSATYTFYRVGNAYRYYNSESDAFYLAFPNTAS